MIQLSIRVKLEYTCKILDDLRTILSDMKCKSIKGWNAMKKQGKKGWAKIIHIGILTIMWAINIGLRQLLIYFIDNIKGYNSYGISKSVLTFSYPKDQLLKNFSIDMIGIRLLNSLEYCDHNSAPRPPNDMILDTLESSHNCYNFSALHKSWFNLFHWDTCSSNRCW